MTDNGARALAERLRQNGLLAHISGMAGPEQLADAILANGAVFLTDAAELDRLREWLADEHAILRGPAHGYGGWIRNNGDCPICRALRAALQSEGSAGT